MINPLRYDHLSYIVASYGLFAVATLCLVFGAQARLALVSRRLRVADPRARRNDAA